uniref:Protein SPA1-RELATED 3 n=1 Tax=Cajanus cajan TaxID=3821 RepID=A0A151RIK0_CAJCA|nr:Protein SPA1-RELATED 3 [Cajanus cajan]
MGDTNLRLWLDKPERSVNVFECLHIFRQIVEIVHVAHSQGIVHNVRPSYFVVSSFNNVSFIEPATCSDCGSDALEEAVEIKTPTPPTLGREDFLPVKTSTAYLSNSSCMLSSVVFSAPALLIDETEENEMEKRRKGEEVEGKKQPFPMKQVLHMEESWYTSPEEVAGAPNSSASDAYRLGVLLFELFCPLGSREEKNRTMSSLTHRVLPPQLLLKWPKEASFCLWLLHPEPKSRPTLAELLQSEFLNEPRDDIEECEAAVKLRERIDNQELLLEFLSIIQQKKGEAAEKLQHTISFLCSDIEEVTKHKTIFKDITGTGLGYDDCVLSKSPRFLKNLEKLESAYFLTRSRSTYSRESVIVTGRKCVNKVASKEQCREGKSPWKNPFLEGLCKYLSFSKLKVKADLKQGDLLQSSNLVCTLSFDRDAEFFATAGANKKIKVFECDTTINEDRDIHYPVVEMVSRSILSSTCWSTYIKSQIASSNFEGVVQLWDVTRNKVQSEMREHDQRVWSIDFSSANPTLLASGSDDGSGVSVGTIKTKANVCCVQFPLDSAHFLAFGSAEHQIYYYDLRNLKVPLCTLVGHNKTVSYIKFVDTMSLISASTDNTLKLWDLSMCASRVIDSPIQSFTGHINVKNFVGLSVSDGYIATGSETNEAFHLSYFINLLVFIYHKAFPMPALSFKFYSKDPLYGNKVDDDSSQFITSVCWRGQSSTLLAANSTGNVKILEMT